ncbi:hypothetical protein [Falsiroseomonas stagni]|nr:hypothetical protein [Falsiroseomonas stagni]
MSQPSAGTAVVAASPRGANPMNSIVYIVGAVVIVLAILSFLGMR